MTFRVGQKVICVDDLPRVSARNPGIFRRFRKFRDLDHNLNKGDVYTVTGLDSELDVIKNERFLTLHVDGAWHFGHREIGFPSYQFRPLVEVKTDISVFTEMLTPKWDKLPA
jgi:hypothetical protein